MKGLDGILDHEATKQAQEYTDSDFGDPNLASFHEAVCDLARQTAGSPQYYSEIPSGIADDLETINTLVLKMLAKLTRLSHGEIAEGR